MNDGLLNTLLHGRYLHLQLYLYLYLSMVCIFPLSRYRDGQLAPFWDGPRRLEKMLSLEDSSWESPSSVYRTKSNSSSWGEVFPKLLLQFHGSVALLIAWSTCPKEYVPEPRNWPSLRTFLQRQIELSLLILYSFCVRMDVLCHMNLWFLPLEGSRYGCWPVHVTCFGRWNVAEMAWKHW